MEVRDNLLMPGRPVLYIAPTMVMMRLVELLDTLEPATRLSNGRDISTAEQLAIKNVDDQYQYVLDRRQGQLVIYRVRQDGVRRKVYRQVN